MLRPPLWILPPSTDVFAPVLLAFVNSLGEFAFPCFLMIPPTPLKQGIIILHSHMLCVVLLCVTIRRVGSHTDDRHRWKITHQATLTNRMCAFPN